MTPRTVCTCMCAPPFSDSRGGSTIVAGDNMGRKEGAAPIGRKGVPELRCVVRAFSK